MQPFKNELLHHVFLYWNKAWQMICDIVSLHWSEFLLGGASYFNHNRVIICSNPARKIIVIPFLFVNYFSIFFTSKKVSSGMNLRRVVIVPWWYINYFSDRCCNWNFLFLNKEFSVALECNWIKIYWCFIIWTILINNYFW